MAGHPIVLEFNYVRLMLLPAGPARTAIPLP